MVDDIDLSYLDPSFDPSKLTKPQLRSILARNGVANMPPATAKKELLIECFEERVRSRADQIRKERARIKPSGKGITFLDEQSQPSPSRLVRSSSPSKTPSPSKTGLSKSPVRSPIRPSAVTSSPTLAVEDSDVSKVNGSSRGRKKKDPSQYEVKVKRMTPRPGSLSKSRSKSRSESRSSTRRDQRPKEENPLHSSPKEPISPSIQKPNPPGTPKSSFLSSPLALLQKHLPGYADSPNSATLKLHNRLGFITSANQMVHAQQAMHNETGALSSNTQAKGKKTRLFGLLYLWHGIVWFGKMVVQLIGPILRTLLILLLAIAIGFYLRIKYVYPYAYCKDGVGMSSSISVNRDGWQQFVQNYCIPCPAYGACRDGNLVCANGYVERPNLVFLGSTCVPDFKKIHTVEAMISATRFILGERLGQMKCGNLEVGGEKLTRDQLGLLLKRYRPLWNNQQFDSLFQLAIENILVQPDGITIAASSTGSQLFQAQRPIFNLKCKMQMFIYGLVRKYQYYIIGILGLFLSIGCLYLKIRWWKEERQKIEELVHAVLQILAEQDALNRRDPITPSTISIHQLRDALFLKTSQREKARLWPIVCQRISNNSNVRESVMNIKGEHHRVWEWIGMDILSPLKSVYGTPPGKSSTFQTIKQAQEASPSIYPTSKEPIPNNIYPTLPFS